jgi:uncharacterized protein (TIGR03435 family)
MRKQSILTTAGIVALAAPIVVGALALPRLRAQAPTAQSPAVPQWETDAGGKLAFEVVSVKQNKSGLPGNGGSPVRSNVPMDPGSNYSPNGGLFTATNWTLGGFIAFAYKLDVVQLRYAMPGLPAWANSDRFDIEARAQGNPTKDQMRLMMQSLLADRFKLVLHAETRQMPFYALVLDKPGKLGPQLQSHSDDPPCTDINTPSASRGLIGTTIKVPPFCDQLQVWVVSGHLHPAARGLSLPVLASYMPDLGQLGRPVLDRTGLSGTFDVWMDYTPQTGQPLGVANPDPSDPAAPPSFITALREQLGLKLESQTGPVNVLVLDHIEEPSPN